MRLILFDIDGTLMLNGPVTQETFERCFEEVCGFPPAGERFSFSGMTDRGIFRRMLLECGCEESFDELFEPFSRHFCAELARVYPEAEGPLVLPGVTELLRRLTDDGTALALATGNIRDTALVKLGRFRLDVHFPVGGFGGDFEMRHEVFAEGLRAARQHYGHPFEAGASWVVGDTRSDVEAARAVGMRVLAVRTGFSSDDGLDDADVVLDDLGDTPCVLEHLRG